VQGLRCRVQGAGCKVYLTELQAAIEIPLVRTIARWVTARHSTGMTRSLSGWQVHHARQLPPSVLALAGSGQRSDGGREQRQADGTFTGGSVLESLIRQSFTRFIILLRKLEP